MKIEAVIFDLDGTLTEPFLDFDLIRREIGLPQGVCILTAISQLPRPQQFHAEQILTRHEDLAAENSRLNDGANKVLEILHKRGLPVGLLTRNLRRNAELVARQHGLYFTAIVDRNDGPAKPDGFGVRFLCKQFGADPSKTLVIGDFRHDLESAKHAGAIAVLLRTHHQSEDFAHLADFTITRLEEVLSIIDNIETTSEK